MGVGPRRVLVVYAWSMSTTRMKVGAMMSGVMAWVSVPRAPGAVALVSEWGGEVNAQADGGIVNQNPGAG